MKASIEDLKKGDTVIVAIGSVLAEVKLLRQPQKAKLGKTTTWAGKTRWMSVLCAIREEEFSSTYNYGNNQTRVYKYKKAVIANGQDYTKEKRVDFTDKVCWIIKREEEC